MENRSVTFGVTGITLLVAFAALAFRGAPAVGPAPSLPAPSPPSPEVSSANATPDPFADYDRGRRLLSDFAGETWRSLVRSADSVRRGQLAMLRAATGRAPTRTDSLRLASLRVPLRISIALLPDPYDSHMDWSYDGNLEAIRRAFGTAGYVPQGFWLPERRDSVSLTLDGQATRFSAHDVHAGVLLFRSTAPAELALHLLYVVPEIPTSGVHLRAMRAALSERAAILREPSFPFHIDARERTELSVLGPSFSGSSQSLRLLLDGILAPATRTRASEDAPLTARVVSGSATAFSNLTLLTDNSCVDVPLRHSDPASPATERIARLRYAATVNPDEAMDQTLDSLVQSLHLQPHHVALLTESGTSYGAARPGTDAGRVANTRAPPGGNRDCAADVGRDQARALVAQMADASPATRGKQPDSSAAHPGRGFLTVPFPLNIASLRVAIEQAPAAREPAQSLPSLGEAPRTRLTLDDVSRPRESPSLASTLTVPSLDVVLGGLVRTLREHGIRLVVIKATDVRDKLMLAREVRRGLPDALVVLYEGNVLLQRPEFADAMRGVFVLSSYPVTLENQFWSTSHRRSADSAYTRLADLLALSSDGAIGVYNATLSLLDIPDRRVEFSLHNAFPGDRSYFLPPVWLSVVGRDGTYPVWAHVPRAAWWPYLGVRDARIPDDSVRPERPHQHTFQQLDLSLTFVVVTPMALLLVLTGILLHGRRALAGRVVALPAFVDRPRTARESLFFALFLLSLVAGYLPFAVAVDARRTIGSLDPLGEGPSLIMLLVGVLSGLVLLVALVLLGNGWFGVLRPRRGVSTPNTSDPSEPQPPPAADATSGPSAIMQQVSEFLAPMRAPARATGQGQAIVAQPVDDALERATTRTERPLMVRLGLAVITLASLSFVATSLRYTWHLLQLAADGGPEATLAMYRAMHLTSGVSPLLPLVLLAVGFAIWTWWQRQQTRTLDEHQPFENGLRQLALPKAGQSAWQRAYRAAVEARRGMGWIAPGFGAVGILAGASLIAWFLWRRRLPSLEAIAHGGGAERWFDLALWLGLLSLLVSSSWAIYRLVYTWHGLERFLDVIAGTPLSNAFARLPLDMVRVTDVGFLGFRRDGRSDDTFAAEQWMEARQLTERAAPPDERDSPLGSALGEVAQGAKWRWQQIHLALCALSEGWRVGRARPQPGKDVPLEAEPLPAHRTPALRSLEEYVAFETVLFVEGYLRNLRRLCFFLFASLLILVTVSALYPYQPRSIIALASLLLLGATVVSVFWVMVRLSRNETISRISRTEPGRVTWDTSFVLNVVTFGVVPLLAFASSEFPAVRTFLFSWAEPLVRAVART